jgi:glutathione S-transferase
MYRLHGFFTQNTMKTLYVLEALGVEYEYCYVDLMQRENRSESFMEKTPIGKVPVLEHDGEFLFESGAICRYVSSVEKSPLFPADKLARARVDQWMTFFTCHPGRWLTEIYFEKIIKPKAGMGETDPVACQKAERFIHQQLRPVERRFEFTDWLANDAMSTADIFALGYMEQVHAIDFSLDDYPRMKDWLSRLEALDSTARARTRVRPYLEALRA